MELQGVYVYRGAKEVAAQEVESVAFTQYMQGRASEGTSSAGEGEEPLLDTSAKKRKLSSSKKLQTLRDSVEEWVVAFALNLGQLSQPGTSIRSPAASVRVDRAGWADADAAMHELNATLAEFLESGRRLERSVGDAVKAIKASELAVRGYHLSLGSIPPPIARMEAARAGRLEAKEKLEEDTSGASLSVDMQLQLPHMRRVLASVLAESTQSVKEGAEAIDWVARAIRDGLPEDLLKDRGCPTWNTRRKAPTMRQSAVLLHMLQDGVTELCQGRAALWSLVTHTLTMIVEKQEQQEHQEQRECEQQEEQMQEQYLVAAFRQLAATLRRVSNVWRRQRGGLGMVLKPWDNGKGSSSSSSSSSDSTSSGDNSSRSIDAAPAQPPQSRGTLDDSLHESLQEAGKVFVASLGELRSRLEQDSAALFLCQHEMVRLMATTGERDGEEEGDQEGEPEGEEGAEGEGKGEGEGEGEGEEDSDGSARAPVMAMAMTMAMVVEGEGSAACNTAALRELGRTVARVSGRRGSASGERGFRAGQGMTQSESASESETETTATDGRKQEQQLQQEAKLWAVAEGAYRAVSMLVLRQQECEGGGGGWGEGCGRSNGVDAPAGADAAKRVALQGRRAEEDVEEKIFGDGDGDSDGDGERTRAKKATEADADAEAEGEAAEAQEFTGEGQFCKVERSASLSSSQQLQSALRSAVFFDEGELLGELHDVLSMRTGGGGGARDRAVQGEEQGEMGPVDGSSNNRNSNGVGSSSNSSSSTAPIQQQQQLPLLGAGGALGLGGVLGGAASMFAMRVGRRGDEEIFGLQSPSELGSGPESGSGSDGDGDGRDGAPKDGSRLMSLLEQKLAGLGNT